MLDKDATLSGGWDATFTTQSGASIIDGEGSRRGIASSSGVTAILDRFTVQNGSVAVEGGGIFIDGGELVLNNSTIRNNSALEGAASMASMAY